MIVPILSGPTTNPKGRGNFVRGDICLQRYPDLPKIVNALRIFRSELCTCQRWKEQASQDCNDGDDHQELDQGKGAPFHRLKDAIH